MKNFLKEIQDINTKLNNASVVLEKVFNTKNLFDLQKLIDDEIFLAINKSCHLKALITYLNFFNLLQKDSLSK